jgi:hypothetical protein
MEFTFKHIWQKSKYSYASKYHYKLGVWAKRQKVVGRVIRGDVKNTFSSTNLVNHYMIGINLIICEMWVSFTFKPTFGS